MSTRKRWRHTSADYLKHRAAWKRARFAPQHDYDGKCPLIEGTRSSTRDAVRRQDDLVRYAAAMGKKHGMLPDDLSGFRAFDIRQDDGTAVVEFQRGELIGESYFRKRFEPAKGEAPVRVICRFLDWVPAAPTEEIIDDEVSNIFLAPVDEECAA